MVADPDTAHSCTLSQDFTMASVSVQAHHINMALVSVWLLDIMMVATKTMGILHIARGGNTEHIYQYRPQLH